MPKTLMDFRHIALIKLLVEKRKQSGMTQAEFADRLSEHQSFVARLESGQRRVDVIELIKFGDIFRTYLLCSYK